MMVEQNIAPADLTTSVNGEKRIRSSGWFQTEDAKRSIKEALRRKAKEKQKKLDALDKWEKLLLLRGARPQIIAKLLSSSQDENEENTKSINFAKGLLNEGLISEDLTDWRFLFLSYSGGGRSPASFFDMLRLEVFYRGIQKGRKGDLTLISVYRNIGYKIDPEGFEASLAEEEDYVAALIDGKPAGIDEDRFGYYREDREGNRWRQPVASGDSGIIVDSSMQSVSRRICRDSIERDRELAE